MDRHDANVGQSLGHWRWFCSCSAGRETVDRTVAELCVYAHLMERGETDRAERYALEKGLDPGSFNDVLHSIDQRQRTADSAGA